MELMEKKRPTFLGIGAHKGGTGWLYTQLLKHPDIWLPPKKEIHFFDRSPKYPSPNTLSTASPWARLAGSRPWERPKLISDTVVIARNLAKGRIRNAAWWSCWTFGHYDEEWYSSLFARAPSGAECGEITPAYSMLDREDIDRIAAVNPKMKFIFMIRHPVERCWSTIRYNVDRGLSKLDLDAESGLIKYLQELHVTLRADYERTLDNYLSRFDRKQILVCFYDAIQADPVGLMSSITSFLGVAPFPRQRIDSETRVNASPMREMPEHVRNHLWATYRPMIHRLADRFGSYAARWDASGSAAAGSPVEMPSAVHP